MIITLTRTGGFAGIPLKKTIDTSLLPKDQAKKIEKLVGAKDFSLQKTPIKMSPDRFIYTISVENEAISHTVTLEENSLSPSQREIITYLENNERT